MKLQGQRIYLAALEREDCKKLWEDQEYDFDNPMTDLTFGLSAEKANDWFEDINKRLEAGTHVRLGVFLNDGTVIGDVALQDIDKEHRSCSLGMNIPKIDMRGKGYGKEAVRLILKYGFCILGLERIWARTYETNSLGQKSLENAGFTLEGIKRKAIYFCGERVDEYHYGMLREEFGCGERENGSDQEVRSRG